MRWETQKIQDLIVKAMHGAGHQFQLTIQRPGGDWDTESILIDPLPGKHDRLWLCGFRAGDKDALTQDEWSDADVCMLELDDGLDSRGGLNSSDTLTCAIYATLVSTLRQAGWIVVNKMDSYF